MDDSLSYRLRVNYVFFAKFRYIAKFEGRSANKQIEQLIKQCVQEFEEKHGEIVLSEEENY